MDDARETESLASSQAGASPEKSNGSIVQGNGRLSTPRDSRSSSRTRFLQHSSSNIVNAAPAADHATATSIHSVPLQQMMAASLHASRVEQVDVAIVGAGLCGLACAAAVHRVRPDCVVKVYERRPDPLEAARQPANSTDADDASASDDDDSEYDDVPIGGGVRLEANGLKALTAISRKIAAGVLSEGVYAQHVLLHDTETGTVITQLQEQPHLSSSSPRQPALVVGWTELEQLLLSQLPPDTVQWGAIATSYTDTSGPGGVVLELLTPKPAPDVRQHLTASPAEAAARVVSPFHAVSGLTGASNWGVSRASRPTTPAPATAFPGSDRLGFGPAGAGGSSSVGSKGVELERVLVETRLLIAADGPMSLIRKQLAGDGPPQFDGTVRWVGRLPGDLLSTIPVGHEAWWLGPGVTFNSHPLRCGDVVWEAQVSSSTLTAAGLQWDEASHSLIPISASQDLSGPGPDSQAAAAAAPGDADVDPADEAEPSAAENGTAAASAAAGSSTDDKEAAAVAAAPAGEWEPGDGEEVVAAASAAAAETHAAATDSNTGAAAGTGPMGVIKSPPGGKMPTQALLQQLFATFPAPVIDMISATPPSCVLEASVHTRPARLIPASLGRGGVAVMGQAACPLRPTGQECSQALEDAAEFGAAIMACGISREALRRLEIKRRPRWKHAMQVSQALGSVSNLGGASLHQGLLDYTAQLHNISFVPLRTVPQTRKSRTKQILRAAAYVLVASGVLAAIGGAADHFGKDENNLSKGPVGQVLAGVEEIGAAAGEVLNNVTSAAAALPEKLAKVVSVGGSKASEGVGTTLETVGELAEDVDTSNVDSSKVYGNVPGDAAGGRVRKALLGRVMGIGGVMGRPLARLAKNRVTHQIAKDLGAF